MESSRYQYKGSRSSVHRCPQARRWQRTLGCARGTRTGQARTGRRRACRTAGRRSNAGLEREMEGKAAGARMVGRQDAQVQAGRVTRAAGGAVAPGYQPEHKLTPTDENCVRGYLHHTKTSPLATGESRKPHRYMSSAGLLGTKRTFVEISFRSSSASLAASNKPCTLPPPPMLIT